LIDERLIREHGESPGLVLIWARPGALVETRPIWRSDEKPEAVSGMLNVAVEPAVTTTFSCRADVNPALTIVSA